MGLLGGVVGEVNRAAIVRLRKMIHNLTIADLLSVTSHRHPSTGRVWVGSTTSLLRDRR